MMLYSTMLQSQTGTSTIATFTFFPTGGALYQFKNGWWWIADYLLGVEDSWEC